MSVTTSKISEQTGSIPPYLSSAFEELVKNAKGLSKKEYEPYEGRRVVEFPTLMDRYFDIVSSTGSYRPYISSAVNRIDKGSRSFVGKHEKYMKPYKESVLKKLPLHATRTFEHGIMPEFQKRFLKTNQPRSLRNKKLAGQVRSDLKNVYGEQVSEGMSKAYRNAMQNYNIHKARQLEAAHTLASLGISKQAQQLAHAQSLRESGSLLYDLNQRMADLEYENWKARQRHPYENLSQYASAIQGIPFVPSTYHHTEIPRPSTTWHGSDWKNLGLNILGNTLTSGLSSTSHQTSPSSFSASSIPPSIHAEAEKVRFQNQNVNRINAQHIARGEQPPYVPVRLSDEYWDKRLKELGIL